MAGETANDYVETSGLSEVEVELDGFLSESHVFQALLQFATCIQSLVLRLGTAFASAFGGGFG